MATYPLDLIYRPARWSLKVTTEPASEPVTTAELREHGRFDDADTDTYVDSLGKAARRWVESSTNRALITQTRTLTADRFPAGDGQVIELPGGVVQSVSSVSYQDTTDSMQAWASSNYELDLSTDGGTARLGLAYNKDWPDVRDDTLAVTIVYVAGYGGASAVPEDIKLAIKMIAADFYDRRAAQDEMAYSENMAVRNLLSPYRIHRIA